MAVSHVVVGAAPALGFSRLGRLGGGGGGEGWEGVGGEGGGEGGGGGWGGVRLGIEGGRGG